MTAQQSNIMAAMENVIPNGKILTAILNVKKEAAKIQKNGSNPAYKGSKYIKLEDIVNSLKEPLINNNLFMSHDVLFENGMHVLVTTLFHESGETMLNKFPMFLEKSTNQGLGSARTYACRYGICNLFGIVADEDDDGNEAEQNSNKRQKENETPKFLNKEQVLYAKHLLEKIPEAEKKILKDFKLEDISQLNSDKYDGMINFLNKKISEMAIC